MLSPAVKRATGPSRSIQSARTPKEEQLLGPRYGWKARTRLCPPCWCRWSLCRWWTRWRSPLICWSTAPTVSLKWTTVRNRNCFWITDGRVVASIERHSRFESNPSFFLLVGLLIGISVSFFSVDYCSDSIQGKSPVPSCIILDLTRLFNTYQTTYMFFYCFIIVQNWSWCFISSETPIGHHCSWTLAMEPACCQFSLLYNIVDRLPRSLQSSMPPRWIEKWQNALYLSFGSYLFLSAVVASSARGSNLWRKILRSESGTNVIKLFGLYWLHLWCLIKLAPSQFCTKVISINGMANIF